MNNKWKWGISIVIPTYNRQELLQKTLLSLSRQRLCKSKFEVIVVDDGSTDSTESLVKSFNSTMDICYIYQEDKGFRVAKARNLGIQAARYHVTLFIDSGVLLAPDAVEQHLLAYKNDHAQALIGLCFGFDEFAELDSENDIKLFDNPDVFDYPESLQAYQDCRYEYCRDLNFSLHQCDEPWLLYWTCHVSCLTEKLFFVGGFDEYFNSWGGEDVELALRLKGIGVRFDLITAAKAIHYPHEKSEAEVKKTAKNNITYIHKKHCTLATYLLDQGMNWQQIVSTPTQSQTAKPDLWLGSQNLSHNITHQSIA
ncbi:hypothetical protein PCIT_a1851 [Pseudoalteromonas citrea]|uniref:Glycosyl transferase n=2 Tax=Pseudoalteromonas citrea TaxID=43655 RepID=A0AAD4FS47_9GAMM|nr:glycosyltransferase [Pseudoalteromonas citrea]KAF7771892.1 hypothetical protein PCIT_a1851 [Pseudoalteromonas citrea]